MTAAVRRKLNFSKNNHQIFFKHVFIFKLENLPPYELTGNSSLGDWSSMQKSWNNGLASGFRLKVENACGNCDYSALNGIELICQDGTMITSTVVSFGIWKSAHSCLAGSFLTAFQLRSERMQGSGDDIAANDLQTKCRNGGMDLKYGGGTSLGNFMGWNSCKPGFYICGIQTLV